ncbi:hypothetical protein COV81_00855 [Candidatus Peregrinibacteria bacterium CG11_big_fil_rev_8_21_14_0_20_41_10]|nr:MAG: hypothetical protein COV81_00855 [Candidatus Peregrinibacteria bacterium CG11_big_fil_rev_8_21_14_0_20_41_10]PJC38462.1 MAG: hypothetical protein CO045_00095 [Candidatus Peregrinibacteria bacterium CG_4_9_14_0_2_um_filter_41_14]
MADVQLNISDLISTKTGKSVKVIKLSGQMDESNVDDLAPKIYQLIEETEAGTSYVFDLENLVYMNSKSVGYITDWYSKIKAKGGSVVLAKLPPNISDILAVVGITKIVPVAQTMEEAQNML